MVLWQLDTGRKQFLPHLPSPICNIVVSPTGTLYGLKLADNSTIVLSARELQPHATITGLQLRAKVYRPGDPSRKKSRHPLRAMPAALHPRHPDQLLIAVPTGETSEGSHRQLNSSVIQTYDIRTNSHISRQAVARTNATSLQVGPGGSEIGTPDVTHFDVSQDGKWMATIDAWRRPSQDANSKSAADHLEIFLKFWRWSKDTSLWQLVTRIDGPHFLDENPVPVLALGCRPHTHEFVTVGADAVLRFWCPTARQRTGLNSKPDAEEKSETWKCRSIIDLPGPIGCSKFKPLGSASVAFSEDGSVLSVCLPSLSATKPGISLIIDAQKYVVHYSRIGLYSGNPYASKFLGRHLIVASSQSVSAWDTVNDLVRSTRLSDLCPTSSPLASRLLAVNPKTWTLAVATQCPPGNQPCNIESHVQVYDAVSLKLLSQPNLGCCPLALLPDPRSGGYIIIDAAASLRKLGSLDKKASHTIYSSDRTIGLNAGLTKHLSSQVHDGYPQVLPQADLDKIPESHTKGLGDVFDVPSFAMPPASVLFRDVVQSLLAR